MEIACSGKCIQELHVYDRLKNPYLGKNRVLKISSVYGEEASQYGDNHETVAHDDKEKIFVTVTLSPLNEMEVTNNDLLDWECINNAIILYKNSISEFSSTPNAYAYERVFGYESTTREVYEEATKGVVLSALSASIFAFGQTSSGKMYTMSGITEYTLIDIYDHISRNEDRQFKLKFSAMEIYNDVVRDLLTPDDTPLKTP
ncbi:hypothetical protein P3S68_011492 [Capsicum galapagoense]